MSKESAQNLYCKQRKYLTIDFGKLVPSACLFQRYNKILSVQVSCIIIMSYNNGKKINLIIWMVRERVGVSVGGMKKIARHRHS